MKLIFNIKARTFLISGQFLLASLIIAETTATPSVHLPLPTVELSDKEKLNLLPVNTDKLHALGKSGKELESRSRSESDKFNKLLLSHNIDSMTSQLILSRGHSLKEPVAFSFCSGEFEYSFTIPKGEHITKPAGLLIPWSKYLKQQNSTDNIASGTFELGTAFSFIYEEKPQPYNHSSQGVVNGLLNHKNGTSEIYTRDHKNRLIGIYGKFESATGELSSATRFSVPTRFPLDKTCGIPPRTQLSFYAETINSGIDFLNKIAEVKDSGNLSNLDGK